MLLALLLLPAAFIILGLLLGRWWVVLAAVAVWVGIALFLVANDGWYGAGWGEFGVLYTSLSAGVTIWGAIVAVVIRRFTNREERRRAARV